MSITCLVCAHHCTLEDGQTGFCRARMNQDGKNVCINYGEITSLALDPIEKKPLRRFYPGTKILSVGSYGCNFSCPFCQNYSISMTTKQMVYYEHLSPEQLAEKALFYKEQGNIGIAYTYNEPLIGFEYVRDTAILAKKRGLKNVVVTNGSVSIEVLTEILPYIDAFNIDLKGFSENFYQMVYGNLYDVKHFIELAAKYCHIEITTLIIPEENDSEEEIHSLAKWISNINPTIPLHLSRFFPCYHMQEKEATEVKKIYELADIARDYLNYVYTGNC